MSLRMASTLSSSKPSKEIHKSSGLFSQIPLLNRIRDTFTATLKGEEEEEITNLDYELSEIASYGFPGNATCTSYDPVQKLLAIGTSVGRVVILGRNGLALRLRLTSDQKVNHILFLSHLPLIIAIDNINQVYLIDIANLTINVAYKSIHNITSIEAYSDSKWVFLGTDLGEIFALDVICGFHSLFTFDKVSSKVIFLKLHPTNCQLLLVGCTQGTVSLINLKSGKITSTFDLNTAYHLVPPTFLTSLVWNPLNDNFAAGYSNGWVVFWDIKESQPTLIRTATLEILDIGLELALPEQRGAITNLLWCQYSNSTKTSLIISGGEDHDTDSRITIVDFPTPDQLAHPGEEFSILIPFNVVKSMSLFPSESPWYSNTLDPFAILLVSDIGTTAAYNLQGDNLQLPVLLQWLDCDFIQSKLLSNIPPALHNSILAHEKYVLETHNYRELKLKGGVWQPKQVNNMLYDLVLTSHKDGKIRVWDASSNTLSPISHLTLFPEIIDSIPIHPFILDFNRDIGCIIVGFKDNSVVVYNFCKEPQCSIHSSPASQDSGDNAPSQKSNEVEQGKNNRSENFLPEDNVSDVRIRILSHAASEVNSVFPQFKVLGHTGNLIALRTYQDLLVISDSEGGLSISNLQLKEVVYFERGCFSHFSLLKPIDIKTVPRKPSRRRDGPKRPSGSPKQDLEKEHIVEIDFKDHSGGFLCIIAISSSSNAYLYTLTRSVQNDSIVTLSKGRVGANLPSEENALMVSFYDHLKNKTADSPLLKEKQNDTVDSEAEAIYSPPTTIPRSSTCVIKEESSIPLSRNSSAGSKLISFNKTRNEKKSKNQGVENDDHESINSSNRTSLSKTPIGLLNLELFNSKEYYVICFASKIMICRLCDQKLKKEIVLDPERGLIIKSKWIRREEHDILICLTSNGFVDMYKLPCLRSLYKSATYMSKAYKPEQCTIANDGRIVVNINGHELRQLCFEKNHPVLSSPLNSKIQLFDPTRTCPENSFREVPWYALPFSSSQPEFIKKQFDKGRPENTPPIDRTKSNHNISIKTYSNPTHTCPAASSSNSSCIKSTSKSTSPSISPKTSPSSSKALNADNNKPSSGLAKMLNQTTDMLREREEKLGNIDNKTSATADAAHDFLQEIKAYNERQSKKKWYQI